MASNPPSNIYSIHVSLWQYLIVVGSGFARNISFSIAAGATAKSNPTANIVGPDTNNWGIMLHSVEFDGVQSGMVAFDFLDTQGNNFAGYAVNAAVDILDVFIQGNLIYTINNTQTTPIVVNFDFLTIPQNIAQSDVLAPLFQVRPSGLFGVVTA